jgi:hypothetical protein
VVLIFLLRVKNIGRDSHRGLTRALPAPTPSPQASAVFDIGEEYEFEIIKEDDGDGCLTLSVRKIQVRFQTLRLFLQPPPKPFLREDVSRRGRR